MALNILPISLRWLIRKESRLLVKGKDTDDDDERDGEKIKLLTPPEENLHDDSSDNSNKRVFQ
jgi:hypothetical protein